MRYSILGSLSVTSNGREFNLRSHKQQVLLTALLLGADQVVPTSRLIEELWGDNIPRRAEGNLYVHICQLRKFLAETSVAGAELLTRPPGYLLRTGAAKLDSVEFARLVARGREELGDGCAAEAAAILDEAIRLHRGPVLGGLPGGPIVTNFAVLVEESRLECLELWIKASLALGRHREVVGQLYSLTAAHPLREQFYQLLMIALSRCGRPADALSVYRRARAVMAQELGIGPGLTLRELHRGLLAGGDEMAAALAS